MAARVYECEASEAQKLKKLLSYDPYLDTNLIPKTREVTEKDLANMSEDEKKRIAEQDSAAKAALEKLRNDPLANAIFARQDCDLREGKSIGIEDSKSYLYIKATDEFLDLAEQRFKKEFKTIKRAPSEIEKKFIALKEDEENRANSGFGMIFGG
ncbi:MAG: hypothetical protein M1504_03410 [Candidatus Marsarchaeota archaeon]|nr:hypothetical protein [Candidatus Marsarchaeota archaeon]